MDVDKLWGCSTGSTHGPTDRTAHKFVWLLSANHRCVLWPVDQWECSIFAALNLWAWHGPTCPMEVHFTMTLGWPQPENGQSPWRTSNMVVNQFCEYGTYPYTMGKLLKIGWSVTFYISIQTDFTVSRLWVKNKIWSPKVQWKVEKQFTKWCSKWEWRWRSFYSREVVHIITAA